MYFYVAGPDNIIGNGATDPNEKAYAFVLNPTYFTAGSTYKTSSDPVDTALNAQIVPNSAPQAVNDTATTLENTAVSGNVLSNDSDANLDALTVSQFSLDTNGDGTAETFAAGASARPIAGVGTIAVAADGSFTFTPATGFSGAVPAVTYTVSDGTATATATLTVTVTPINDPPTSTNDTKAVNSGVKTLLSISDFGTYADPDGDAWASVKITTLPTTGLLEYFNGVSWVSVTADQVVSVADISASRLRFTGDASTTPSLQFQVSDGTNFSTVSYTLAFTVTTVANQSPVAVPDTNTVTVALSNVAQGNVLPNDSDPDGANSQLTVARASGGATLGAGGSTIVNIPSGGSAIAANGELPTYTTFTVTWANSSAGARPQAGVVLTLSGTGIPAGTTATIASSNSLTDTLLVAGLRLTSYTNPSNVTFTWTNGGTQSATRDMTGGTNVSTRVIAVTNAAITLSVGMSVAGTGIASGTTITSIVDDGSYRLVTLSQPYTGATPTDVQFTASTAATITGLYGSLSLQANGAYTYTVNGGVASGSIDRFTYEIKDGSNATASTTLTITILDVNQAPVNDLTGSYSVSQGASLRVSTLSVSDANVNLTSVTLSVTSGTLTVTEIQASQVTGNGSGAITITGTQSEINAMLLTLVYASDPGFAGTAALSVTSTDSGGLQDTDAYNIAVIAAPTVSGTTVNEASGHVYFSVNGLTGEAVTLAVRSGTATLGGDFLLNLQYYNGSSWVAYTGAAVTIPASGSLLVRVPVVQDMVNEGAESLFLDAANISGVQQSGQSNIIDDGSGTLYSGAVSSGSLVTTTDTLDDDRPLTVSSVTVNEASAVAIFAVFGAAGQRVASLALAPGTASSGTDFGTALEYFDGANWVAFVANTAIPASGTLLARVAIVNDGPIDTGPYEGAETFAVIASNTGGATFSGIGVVRDDGTGSVFDAANTSGIPDAGQPLDRDSAVTVTTLTPIVNEVSAYAFFSVVGTAGAPLMLSVNDVSTALNLSEQQRAAIEYSADGQVWTQYTYVESTGFGDKPTPLDDGSGKGAVYVRVAIGNEQDSPAVFEGSETFELVATTIPLAGTVTQSAFDSAAIVDDGAGQVYQANLTSGSPTGSSTGTDDDRPSFSIDDVTVNEGAGTITFTVTKTGATTKEATVAFSTANGTAMAIGDYTATSGTLTFAVGDASKTVIVTITDDGVVEPSETFDVRLISAANATISHAIGVGTILDDDFVNRAPLFTDSGGTAVSSYSFTYAENRATTDVLGQVYATDADGDVLTFSITSNVTNGNGDPLYAIDGSTGEITLTAAGVAAFKNDFETATNSHQITVAVSDGSAPATTVQVTLTETNEDDNNPVFTNQGGTAVASYAFSYAENRATTDVLGQVYATDADGDTLTFSITSNVTNGSGDPLYAIDAATGEITLTAAGVAAFTNDYEATGNSHQITVSVSDGSAPATTVQVTLTETNEDDNNPVFTNQGGTAVASYSFTYAENRATTDVLGQVYATDADGDVLTFSITSNVTNGNGDPLYAIDSSTGEITLTAAGVAAFTNDFETTGNSHQITVSVSDGSAPATTVQVTLTETNEDDNNPVFTNQGGTAVSSYSFTYAENRATTDVLGQVYATDADGDVLTFSITSNVTNGSGDPLYAIDSSTGEITLTAAGIAAFTNDYEAIGNSHQITVSASDGSALATTITVTLTEADVFEVGRANDDSARAGEAGGVNNGQAGRSAAGNVLGNDTGDGPGTVVVVRSGGLVGHGMIGAPGSPLAGQYGVLILRADGGFLYTPDDTNPAVDALSADGTLTDSFNYTRLTGGRMDSAVLRVTIVGANDSPILVTTVINADGIPANTGLPEQPSGRVGILVESLANPTSGTTVVTDVDAGGGIGFAVVGADQRRGSWWFSLNDGATWGRIGSVTAARARLLPATARLFFRPNRGTIGEIPGALVIRAWDGTAGVAGRIMPVAGLATSLSSGTARLGLRVEVPGVSVIDLDALQSPIVAAPAGDLMVNHTGRTVRTVSGIGRGARVTTMGSGATRLLNPLGDLTLARGGSGIVRVVGLATTSQLNLQTSFGMVSFASNGRVLSRLTPSQALAIKRSVQIIGRGTGVMFVITATI